MLWKVVLSALLLTLSFPNFNLEFLAWFAFVPLFFTLRRVTTKEAFFLSYLCGLVFFGLTIYWVHYVSILGYIILILILSIFFGLFGLFSSCVVRRAYCEKNSTQYAIRNTQYATFIIPALWVFLEYLRSNLFTGFGWALLGYSQYLNLPVIQISDITGAYGVSFLVMMVNVMIYNIFSLGKKAIPASLVGLFILFSVFGYGYFKLAEANAAEGTLNISLIQGNIPQNIKWKPQYKDKIFTIYKSLTKSAGRDEPDLVIWPETALPGFIEEEAFSKRLQDLAKDVNADLLIGAPSYSDSENEDIFNSALLISKEGKHFKRYDKLHLVPFGEYVPFARFLNFLRDFIDKPIGDFAKGSEYTVFELEEGVRFSVLICFEDIFPNLVRNFAVRDVDFLINITNDAWFKKTGAPYQHAQPSVFRAVENRVPVVRAANTGFSCFIDGYGRIIDAVRVNNDEIFVMGYKTKRLSLFEGESFYKRFGDIFTFFCITALIINGGWIWLKRRR